MNILATFDEVRGYLEEKFPGSTIIIDEGLCPHGLYHYTRSNKFFDDMAHIAGDIQELLDHGYLVEEVLVRLTKDDNENFALMVDLLPYADCIDIEQ